MMNNKLSVSAGAEAKISHIKWSDKILLILFLSCIGLFSLTPMVVIADDMSHQSEKSIRAKHARNRTLAMIKKATLPYTQVGNALKAGYVSSIDLGAGCVTSENEGLPKQLGGMGIHFVKLDQIGQPNTNFQSPSVLVYAPDPEVENCTYSTAELMAENAMCRNSLRLVAVEELIFAHLWEAQIGKAHWMQPPEFLDNQFYYVHDNPDTTWVDEAHAFPPHYELHIWLHEHNAAGLFSAWNPNISCPDHMSAHGH